jgi:hypothetical protein
LLVFRRDLVEKKKRKRRRKSVPLCRNWNLPPPIACIPQPTLEVRGWGKYTHTQGLMQVHPGAIGHMPGGFGTMSAAASRTIVPLMLSHKGHDEKLQIEDMDDPAEPQRFFKLPRGRLCSLRLLLPFATANLKQDIYVKLCGSRGMTIPAVYASFSPIQRQGMQRIQVLQLRAAAPLNQFAQNFCTPNIHTPIA